MIHDSDKTPTLHHAQEAEEAITATLDEFKKLEIRLSENVACLRGLSPAECKAALAGVAKILGEVSEGSHALRQWLETYVRTR